VPTKRLPPQPSLAHLKHQAVDLLEAHRARVVQALHRLREFHPRMRGRSDAAIADSNLKLSDAYLAIAREYGFPSWPKLKAFVENGNTSQLSLPAHERIVDPDFRRAVTLVDSGDAKGLRAHLHLHPDLVRRHVTLYGGNYFQTPTLLEFVAENPSRRGTLPSNIAEIARVILDAGARSDRATISSTIGLAASSSVARECAVQNDLIDLLCEYGGDPNAGVLPALLYAEFDAVDRLLARGAVMTLISAAALGCAEEVRRLVTGASDDERRLALALAAQHGRTDAVRTLLEAGVDPNGFTPVQGHAHATALHQAAGNGFLEIVQLLIEHGAHSGVRDILFEGTPADWAEHGGHAQLADRLRAKA
jgi:ankyrin repeat protein